jgi:hypothetical protein
VPGFENTFYSIPENTFTLGAWTLNMPFPIGKIWPKREILNFKL